MNKIQNKETEIIQRFILILTYVNIENSLNCSMMKCEKESMVKSSKLSCSGKAFDMGVVSVRRMVSPSELVVVWSVYQVSSSYNLLEFRFPLLGNSEFYTSQLWFDKTL